MNSVQEMLSFEYNIEKNKNSMDKLVSVVRRAPWIFSKTVYRNFVIALVT